MSIKPIIAANWKMNKTPNEGIEYFDEIKSNFLGNQNDITILIGIPFTGLNSFSSLLHQSSRLHKTVIGSKVEHILVKYQLI